MTLTTRHLRRVFLLGALAGALGGALLTACIGAQSIRVSPPRLGGDPLGISNASFPSTPTIFPPTAPNSGIQGITLTITGANLTAFQDFTVADVNYVNVYFNGWSGFSTATSFQTPSTRCVTNDVTGQPTTSPCNSGWITTSVQSPTVLRVTGNRSSAGDGTVTSLLSVFVADLNPALVNYVTRGVVTPGGPQTVTNCPNLLKMQTTWLGDDGQDVHTYVIRANNTTVNAQNGFSGADFGAITAGYQVICWK